MIPVTSAVLPPLQEYVKYLEELWESRWLTNNGTLLQTLERRLEEALEVEHVVVVSNGTLALQLAVRALGLHGEVVTTPFSYVATASSLVWEGCRPVFADIEPDALTLDPVRADEAVTSATTGILATHVYGLPCDVERLTEVATRRGLRLLYDAAHAFGVRYRGRSLLVWGDACTLSFHATKLFHTVEGGAVVTADGNLADTVRRLRNFGHTSPESFEEPGINAKTSEFHAAMGLCLLPRVPDYIRQRQVACERYDARLQGAAGVRRPLPRPGTELNFAYYPVLLASEARLLAVMQALQDGGIAARRYFYPSLADLPYAQPSHVPIARDAASRVLCLPLWAGVEDEAVDRIAAIVREAAAA